MKIQTYHNEVKRKRRQSIFFRSVVFVSSIYLFIFFLGYNINFERIKQFGSKINLENLQKIIDSPSTSIKKVWIFKPFWILNVQVFPNPDQILVDWKNYNNWTKVIYNLGQYDIKIAKEWYIWIDLWISLTQENQFYSNTINLLKNITNTRISENFDKIVKLDELLLAKVDKDNKYLIYDNNFVLKDFFVTDYTYLWNKYFLNNGTIFYYDTEKLAIKPLISKETWLAIACKEPKIFWTNLFCYDSMKLITDNNVNKKEKISYINNNLVLTKNYLYNINPNTSTWNYYKVDTSEFKEPNSLIHIKNIPYILENKKIKTLIKKPEQNIIIEDKNLEIKPESIKKNSILEFDSIETLKEFAQDEYLVLGKYKWKNTMLLNDYNQEYLLNLPDTFNFEWSLIYKYNWYFLIRNSNWLYVYYRWGKDIIKIVEWKILWIFDSIVTFKKDDKNYFVNLNEE